MDSIAIIIAFALGFAARQVGLPPLVGYLVAGFAVAGASLGLEILSPEAGAFSVDRLLRNFCGGIAFLTLSAALDHPLRREHDWLRGRPRRLLGWCSLIVLVLVMQSLIPIAISYAGRSGAYPRVVDMTDAWQQRFIQPRDALLHRLVCVS